MQPSHTTARDSLAPAPAASAAERARLDLFTYPPGDFEVTALELPASPPDKPDALVRFPSAKPSGLAPRDEVCLLWFKPADETRPAPACLVMPTLNPDLIHARASARLLAERGLHAFIPIFPGAFTRAPDPQKSPDIVMLEHGPQAVADARRAVDAVRSLPQVAPGPVGLHAMSLGGLLGIAAAGLDNPFGAVLLAATGADPWQVLSTGGGVADGFRQRLAAAGYEGETLRQLLQPVDPTPLLPRIRPARCRVVLPEQDEVFAAASQAQLLSGLEQAAPDILHRLGTHASAHAWLPELADMLADDLLHISPR